MNDEQHKAQMTPEEYELHLLRWFYTVITNCDIIEDTLSRLYDEGEWTLRGELTVAEDALREINEYENVAHLTTTKQQEQS